MLMQFSQSPIRRLFRSMHASRPALLKPAVVLLAAGLANDVLAQPAAQYQVQPSQPYVVPSAQYVVPTQQYAPAAQTIPASALHTQPMPGFSAASTVIQPVHGTAESARAVHHLIQSMPSTTEDMDVIERRSQLIVTKANITRIASADPNVVDFVQYSPRELSVVGLIRGSTTLTIWFENTPDPLIYLVKVIRDPNAEYQRRLDYGKLERKLAQLFPNSKVYLIPMSFKIVVRGQARDAEEAAHILNVVRGEVINQEGGLAGQNGFVGSGNGDVGGFGAGAGVGFGGGGLANRFGVGDSLSGFLVNELRVPGEFQIQISGVVAELSRSDLERMATDFTTLFANGRNAITSSLGGAPGTIRGIIDNGNVLVFLDWIKTNKVGKIVTRPHAVTLSGHPVRLLGGGEFAVPTIIGIGGAQGQSTSFRGYGTSMVVLPTVLDRDLIRMTATAEYSDLNSGAAVNGIPGTSARRISTTVEMREGQTIAMGGLYASISKTEISRIPFLGDIPKVGPLLFSNKRKSLDENELIFLITPEIIRPMEPDEVPPLPGHEVSQPTEHEFRWYNRIEGNPDLTHNHLPPYGSGAVGTNIGYQHFNPGPASPSYSPQPTGNGYQGGQPAPGFQPGMQTMPQQQGIPMGSRPQGTQRAMRPQPDPAMRANFQQGMPGRSMPMQSNGGRGGMGRQVGQNQPASGPGVTPVNYQQGLRNAGVVPAGGQAPQTQTQQQSQQRPANRR